ncbi:MAG: T9SS type A sorting domain-containing protein [Elusimicrobia bacterium]|nr:T9SS type A sorting domain-containing protein [Elusimicrobiota bacterium]MBP9698419.1 T9SS type A sorting domain-containing protein [Elusimicrobiota bacterium]
MNRSLRHGLATVSLLAGTVSVLAFDSYRVTIQTDVMKGDPDVVFRVESYQGALPQVIPHNIYISLPSGILENPLADPPNGLDITSIGNWGLFANNSAVAGNTSLTVTEALAPSPVISVKNFYLHEVVRSFEILPPPDFLGTTGTPFNITIRARAGLGGGGAVVKGFNDDVLVSALIGDVVVNGAGDRVSGSEFVDGEAVVSVMLRGTDPNTKINRITVSASFNYFSLGVATGYADVNVNPGSYDHLVMLFPGETLVPGNILITNGKTGAATAATANVAVNQVLVYAVDAFNNPVLAPGPGVTLDFISLSHPATDVVPASAAMGSSVQVFSDAISFQVGNVSHQIRVADHDDATKNSVTTIAVNSGAANLISVGAVSTPQLAGQSFNITARVLDGTPAANTVVSYPSNRPVNVTLTNCAGQGIGEGSLDTNPSLAGVQRTVTFTNGVYTGPIVLYPESDSNLCVKFDDALGNFGVSNGFIISHAGTPRLHVVLPGQTFTAGQAPGNSPSVVPALEAGSMIDVYVYVVDEGWNIWSSGEGPWNPGLVVISLEDDLGNPGYVDLTQPSPLMPGSGNPGNNPNITGVRLRTAYPAGNARLVARMGTISGRSDLFTINPAAYSQMVFVAPGETLARGIQTTIEPDGKTGTTTDQAVNVNIPVSVYLTDEYFNPIINPPAGGWPWLTFSTTAPADAIMTISFPHPFPMTDGDFNNQLVLGKIGANTLRVVDTSPTPKSINQTINVTAGDVTRFVVTPNPASLMTDPIGLQSAGVPFNLTFKAFDQFDNIATQFAGDAYLELWENGAPMEYGGTISPSTITFVAHPVTGGVVANVPTRIYYAGELLGNGNDNLQVRVYITTPTMREGISAFFNVQEAAVWTDMVVSLPGEDLRPGLGPPYKINTPTPFVAGNSVGVTVTAVDTYGNKVNVSGTADLTIPTAGIFANLGSPAQVPFSSGQGVGAIQIYTAGSSLLVASVAGFNDSSPLTVTVGPYSESTGKLVLLAPGETLIPGSPSPPGKDSSGILPVEANTALSFQILACDRFYNIDTTYSGNNKSLSSDDGAISLSNLAINSGSATVNNTFLSGNLPNPSPVRVTATDQSATLKTSDAIVQVTPGAIYVITVPTSTLVGANFNMTVQLIDPITGLPKVGANNNIFIEAFTSSGTAATVPIGVAVATLANGSVSFQQNYGYVETIKIRVTDSFNRLTDSGYIDVVPNGLKYIVTLPPTPKTADALFPVTVGLYDTVQSNLPIRGLAYQHTFNVYVTTISGGGIAEGTTPLAAATFNNGVATFNFGYTKAESIIVNATGTLAGYPPMTGFAFMTIQPGTYVKLMALAPGETHQPGVPSATGKNSTPATQAAGQGFAITVSAVDQYWNVVSSYNSPAETITLSASDGSLAALGEQMFLNGQTVFSNLQLRTPPQVTVTASDTSSPSLGSQSVNIPLQGRRYVPVVASAAPFYTGTDLFIDLELRFYSGASTGALVTGGIPQNIYVEALTPAYQVLPSTNLYVPAQLTTDPSDGTTDVQLRYQVAEDVVLRFYDDDGWQGFSDPIHFVPTDVDYVATLPAQSPVGPPDTFAMTITPRDKLTLTTAKNWTQNVFLTPVSQVGDPITGTLQLSTVSVSGGAVTFQQAFSQSGVFSFQMFDGIRTNMSATMNFVPGPLASIETNLPAVLDAGVSQSVEITMLDAFANPIANQSVSFSLSDEAFGTLSSLTGVSNVVGVASTVFNTNSQMSGPGEFRVTAGGASLRQSFRLLGPPSTSLRVGGMGIEEVRGFALKPGDPVFIDISVSSGTTLLSLTYAVDAGASQVVNGPFTLLPSGLYTFGPLQGLETAGRHTIEFFGVTQTGNNTIHSETVKISKTIYVSAMTTPEEGMVNYPNPFRAGQDLSFLEYHLSADAGVTLAIYDLLGQKVWEQSYSQGENGGQSGLNRVSWDGKNSDGLVVGNGGYVAVLEASDGTKLKRKIAVKK